MSRSLSRVPSSDSAVSFVPLSQVDKSFFQPPDYPQEIQYLTKKDCRLIEKVWCSVSDHLFLAQRIYFQVFMTQPQLKQLYSFRSTPPGELECDLNFHRQTDSLARFLASIVRAVATNNERQVVRLSLYIGVRHAQITRIWFQSDWWTIFRQAILDSMRPYCFLVSKGTNRFSPSGRRVQIFRTSLLPPDHQDCPAYQAWATLLDHVISIMKDGFQRCAQQLIPPACETVPDRRVSVKSDQACVRFMEAEIQENPAFSTSESDLYDKIPRVTNEKISKNHCVPNQMCSIS